MTLVESGLCLMVDDKEQRCLLEEVGASLIIGSK